MGNMNYQELKFLVEQRIGKKIEHLRTPMRGISDGIDFTLYEEKKDRVQEKMQFTEKREGLYTRETPNFIATLTRKEKYAATMCTSGTYKAWRLEVRAYKETSPKVIAVFNTDDIKSHDDIQYRQELVEHVTYLSHIGKLWNNIEEIKKESERILEELRYW